MCGRWWEFVSTGFKEVDSGSMLQSGCTYVAVKSLFGPVEVCSCTHSSNSLSQC